MNETDLKILSEQLSAAEDRIVELQYQVGELRDCLIDTLEIVGHMHPKMHSQIHARLQALEGEDEA